MQTNGPSGAAAHAPQTGFFGHPRGLATLFMTEFWERFSYYGMRALLILFMTAATTTGGLGYDVAQAGAVYGLYTSLVYVVSLPGGWIADRLLGQRRSVLYGGILIAIGELLLAVPATAAFYSGLLTIILGTGLLKPNISTMVGQLYAPEDERRDAGFSIFYMGINMGALAAPLIVGTIGQTINWHYGFLVAGIGMVLGVVQYVLGGKHLGEAGARPAVTSEAEHARDKRRLLTGLLATTGFIAVIAVLALTGIVAITAEGISNAYLVVLLLTVFGLFGWLFFGGDWTREERARLYTIGVLFVGAVIFFSAFEQAGSTLNLFADDFTDRSLPAWLGNLFGGASEFPASIFQSVNALFIILLAPVYAWMWVSLGKRNPSTPTKFALGLLFVGLGFVVLMGGLILHGEGVRLGPGWLVMTYFLHTMGELFLSPVGLSAMTRLAPARVMSLMMGVWFVAASVGNYMGGFLAQFYESMSLTGLFGTVASFCVGGALIMGVLSGPIKRMLDRSKA